MSSKIRESLRYFLEISFNGAAYHGWQVQPNAVSVQEVVQGRLSILLQQSIEVVGAGRTDAGVHAKQMFMHFDVLDTIGDLQHLMYKLNSFLPKDIAVRSMFLVADTAHARFDALTRGYIYLISLKKNPFVQEYAWDIRNRELDLEAMNLASQVLLTHTNYRCFSRSNTDVRTYECTISKAIWTRNEDLVSFEVVANRFLRNMVRAMVGTLIEVGRGLCSQEAFIAILHSDNRSEAGASAPAHGLYLNEITYPKEIIS